MQGLKATATAKWLWAGDTVAVAVVCEHGTGSVGSRGCTESSVKGNGNSQ